MQATFEMVRFKPAWFPELTVKLAECYRQVFATSPWDEWKVCLACKQKWGIDQIATIEELKYRHCDIDVVDFWPLDQVIDDIMAEINQDTWCWLAMIEGRVIGFCWGYPIDTMKLEKKLKLPGVASKIVAKDGNSKLVGYLDEIGVLPEFRGQKIAKELLVLFYNDFRASGLGSLVVRTKKNPPTIIYLWLARLGYEEIAAYNDADQRVILAAASTVKVQ